eukprot:CAMPEP_0178938986 /NCGR_PEP_ID=MMETSP0786-20121207/26632_1 /TAXON_ID=186022 /ORGANISM="Thalassionema frauenfeldii, Strain CCMP 1798" /LENGTH=101 /DNA_ID=CAMNT_0020617759 /DNA_START=1053 /DNA_END=1358 /DNA_ORIENTATION=-
MEKRRQKRKKEDNKCKKGNALETNDQEDLGEIAQQTAGQKILAVSPSIEVDFTPTHSKKRDISEKVARFPMNPEKHWGPKSRAVGKKRKLDEAHEEQVTMT